MIRYLLTPRAENDLVEIARWYRKHRGVASARKVVRDLRAQLVQLCRNPDIGRLERDLGSPEHLFWTYRQYLIVYLRGTTPLQVVTIWDARRGPPPSLR